MEKLYYSVNPIKLIKQTYDIVAEILNALVRVNRLRLLSTNVG